MLGTKVLGPEVSGACQVILALAGSRVAHVQSWLTHSGLKVSYALLVTNKLYIYRCKHEAFVHDHM